MRAALVDLGKPKPLAEVSQFELASLDAGLLMPDAGDMLKPMELHRKFDAEA
jgi:hypothetical protein